MAVPQQAPNWLYRNVELYRIMGKRVLQGYPTSGDTMLRSGLRRAVVSTVRTGGRYILGIDALPRGIYAAVAVGRTITSTFEVASERGRPLPLEERVRAAVAEAEHICGAPPSEVRLVCIDDGSDGDDIARIQEWLTEIVEARILVLDLLGSIEHADIEGSLGGIQGEAALSVARACEAALW